MLHVLYLIFNEGYATSSGPELARTDLSSEAIRLTRLVHAALPEDPEVAGLLALMLLTDARRPARTGADGELVPLAEQDRTPLGPPARRRRGGPHHRAPAEGAVGEYQVQAAIAAVHDQAASYDDTNWSEILRSTDCSKRMTGQPDGRRSTAPSPRRWSRGRRPAWRCSTAWTSSSATTTGSTRCAAHLLELAGDTDAAVAEFRAAAAGTMSVPERDYLVAEAARIAAELDGSESPRATRRRP